ncbi:hypothetical protein PFICI_13586 [Pestalotiopsis fici W106-1]|uniref:Uncharacterized protein n=1 Tax=Pestalotiopsis fici (strain W106-1 / CGMCC3.15140) TaxID=1229662 RepID=W3WPL8_PESFW|nr:uncharacterized protein PFICI_13586 [Pestalotiopsis fici W106-1]ETS75102.1 hypothetical protein PFICI_13586 [Pestalotiopsis fici W106-1]
MWLINVETRKLEEFFGIDRIPKYAALSHTWEDGQEVTFQEFRSSPTRGLKRGYRKIDLACRQAAEDRFKYVWVDTCCIDKSSSAELTEAINSMFNWYERSKQCYVYLCDLSITTDKVENIEGCKWFKRAWTLQELISPIEIKFYNRNWDLCFSKSSALTQLSTITDVDARALNHSKPLNTFSVAQKMSWASSREATRIEDIAYCLLGIFNINMPLLYGEEEKAFLRLQEEIIKTCPDPSIFAWKLPSAEVTTDNASDLLHGVLAPSPEYFSECGGMDRLPQQQLPQFSMTNHGIKLRAQFAPIHFSKPRGSAYVLPVCFIGTQLHSIRTRNSGWGYFVRQDPTNLAPTPSKNSSTRHMLEPYLLTQLHTSSGLQSVNDIRSRRPRCLQFDLRRGMRIYRVWPWLQWDEVDNVFFSADVDETGWSALKIVTYPKKGEGNFSQQSLDFLFYAFNWSESPGSKPECMVRKVSGGLADRSLEDMNDRAVTEGWGPYTVYNRLEMAQIPKHSVILGDTVDGSSPLLTFRLDWVQDHHVSACPLWKVTFDLNFGRSD